MQASELIEGWGLNVEGSVRNTPAYYNETVYFTATNSLYALNDAGLFLWKVNGVKGDVVIDSSGRLLVKYDNKLSSIGHDGNLVWQSDIENHKVVVGRDDRIFTTDSRFIYCLSSDGEIVWRKTFNPSNTANTAAEVLAIDSDGTLYLTNNNLTNYKDFLALTDEGYEKWRTSITHEPYTYAVNIQSDIAISSDRIFLAQKIRSSGSISEAHYVFLTSIDKSGNIVWSKFVHYVRSDWGVGATPDTSVVLDKQNNIVLNALGEIFKYSLAGEEIWRSDEILELVELDIPLGNDDEYNYSSPVISDSNEVLFSDINGVNIVDSEGNYVTTYHPFNTEQPLFKVNVS